MNEFRHIMQSVLKNKTAENWIALMLLSVFAGLLMSRALVSFASVLIVIPFFFHYRRVSSLQYLSLALIFLPVLISGLWSNNTQLWWNSLSIKLPLLTMMLGLSCVDFSKTRRQQLAGCILVITIAGCCWSLLQYSPAVRDAYLKAKTLPTPMDDDHVRFSWLVVVVIVLAVSQLQNAGRKPGRWLLLAGIIFLVIYLHILAARTGLVCLYAAAIICLLHFIFIQKKWKTGLGILLIAAVTAITCYRTIPTLRNRVQYLLYDLRLYTSGDIQAGYSDAGRWLSMRAGYDIMQNNPVKGVGFGDILSETGRWHDQHHPSSLPGERFLPANEWLVYGAGNGWPGVFCFTAGFLLLLYLTTQKNNAYAVALSVISLLPFLIDDTLEGQYGVVILAFIVFFGQQKSTKAAA